MGDEKFDWLGPGPRPKCRYMYVSCMFMYGPSQRPASRELFLYWLPSPENLRRISADTYIGQVGSLETVFACFFKSQRSRWGVKVAGMAEHEGAVGQGAQRITPRPLNCLFN